MSDGARAPAVAGGKRKRGQYKQGSESYRKHASNAWSRLSPGCVGILFTLTGPQGRGAKDCYRMLNAYVEDHEPPAAAAPTATVATSATSAKIKVVERKDTVTEAEEGEEEEAQQLLSVEDALERDLAALEEQRQQQQQHTMGTSSCKSVSSTAESKTVTTTATTTSLSGEGGSINSSSTTTTTTTTSSSSDSHQQQQHRHRFRSLDTGCKGTVFVPTPGLDPRAVCLDILRAVAATGKLQSRFVARMIPVTHCVPARIKSIHEVAPKLLAERFLAPEASNTTFAVDFKASNNNTEEVKRLKVIDALAGPASASGRHSVELSKPPVTIVARIVKTVACLCVAEDFKALKEYNMQAVAAEARKRHPLASSHL